VKNPVDLARLVMERSPHVMLVAGGAEEFALEQGVVLVPRSYFRTRARIADLAEEQQATADKARAQSQNPKGTVGAVALDRAGNLAAATSTGGLTDKHAGRVGDSPIIGAGTYANNQSCAVSGTGDGEFFMRQVVAYDICALVAYRKMTLEQAVNEVIHEKLRATGGTGGVIAVDPDGNIVMDFNTVGMFRAARDSHGRREIAVYRDK
jgi:beta-aspartyl-peptidase (threonine type)